MWVNYQNHKKQLIQLVDDEVIEVGAGGTTEKTNITRP